MKKYNIAVLRDAPGIYTYQFDQKLDIGQIVSIDFRNKEELGIVLDSKDSAFSGKIKKIKSVFPYKILNEYIKFAKFVAEYNILNLGSVFKLIVPFSADELLFPERNSQKNNELKTISLELNVDQKRAVNEISKYVSEFKTILLHGVTGSGKTEVFLEIVKNIMKKNEGARCDKIDKDITSSALSSSAQILILVPEIALSMGLAKKISERLGCEVFLWHNSISIVKKRKIWKKAIEGEKLIIVGARSALFIPFSNLKLVVIDEEHDNSFKQNEKVIYNARDMAVYLGYCLNIPVILSSATPSVESYNNALSGKYIYVRLENRYFKMISPPKIKLIDLKKENLNICLTKSTIDEIKNCIEEKNQALIFVNRRGHTPKILCRSCGKKIICPGCSTWLCYHAVLNEFICHYCGFRTSPKKQCPKCKEETLIGIGTGIEKIYEECLQQFPEAKIMMLSSDTINTNRKISQAIEKIQNKEVDIIIGTQIIAKGHNFGGLKLVVIPVFDSMLYGEDFRLTEKAFQMLYQVSGRAGRSSESSAKIIIQTYNPEEYLIKVFEKDNIEEFYKTEINNRKLLKMPPFSKMISINLSSLSEVELKNFANKLISFVPKKSDIKILGPIQPALYKIKSRYRLKIIFISSFSLQNYINNLISKTKIPNSIKFTLDVDPYDFY